MGRAVRIALGRVVGAHGLRGQLRVHCFRGASERLPELREVVLAESEEDPSPACFAVERAAPGRRGEVRMALAGVERREAAEALQGLLVLAEPGALAPRAAGGIACDELLGLRVEGDDGRRIGTVRALWDTGAHEVLVVESEEGRDILIPAAPALLREVNVEEGRIVVEALPGLLDPV